MNTCKICNNQLNNKVYTAREMMFGLREKFDYLECSECGCLQITEIPDDISKYYPEDYYPFNDDKILKDSCIKSQLKFQLAKYCIYGKKYLLGWLLSKIFECSYLSKLKNLGIKFNSDILDVGTGTGGRLIYLRKFGFVNLTGIDPFIDNDIFYSNGIKIYKKDLDDMNQHFDFIMFNHSFEHMPNPLSVLQRLYHLLRPGKYVLIRIPVADSYLWKKYGINWVALDAPRHLFLHTTNSMRILTQKSGFQLVDISYDSSEKQFWASEQYIRDIPLRDSKSYFENPKNSIFTKKQIKKYKAKTIELNKKNEGDAACFYLYKPSNQRQLSK
jgi:SAM-dependent methyltransferase